MSGCSHTLCGAEFGLLRCAIKHTYTCACTWHAVCLGCVQAPARVSMRLRCGSGTLDRVDEVAGEVLLMLRAGPHRRRRASGVRVEVGSRCRPSRLDTVTAASRAESCTPRRGCAGGRGECCCRGFRSAFAKSRRLSPGSRMSGRPRGHGGRSTGRGCPVGHGPAGRTGQRAREHLPARHL